MASHPSPILGVLLEENERLDRVLKSLGAIPGRRGRPPKETSFVEAPTATAAATSAPRRSRGWTPAQRKAAALRMKQRWSAKKTPKAAGRQAHRS
jgi:hypothetical protein